MNLPTSVLHKLMELNRAVRKKVVGIAVGVPNKISAGRLSKRLSISSLHSKMSYKACKIYANEQPSFKKSKKINKNLFR